MIDLFTVIVTTVSIAPFFGIALYLAKNPEKVEKWSFLISKSLSFLHIRVEKSGLAKDIQGDINSFCQSIDSEKNNFVPYKIKIDWVSKTSREAFIRDGKVIVKMRRYDNQARNFLYAALELTEKGLLPESRHLIDKRVLTALDLSFINKLLTEKKRFDSKQLFIDEIYEVTAKEGSLIEKYSKAFVKLDNQGIFSSVVLPEYSALGRKCNKELQNGKILSDTIAFAEMLTRLANKTQGKDVNPNYYGNYISCSIVLIARSETYDERGLEPYITYINQCVDKGTLSIYVCGIGERNIYIAQKIKDAYESSKKIRFLSKTMQTFEKNTVVILNFESITADNKREMTKMIEAETPKIKAN